jgi:glycosyltransferase involved in cell wall biosynthesis
MSLAFELVLPCYNEEKSLAKILDRAIHAATEIKLTPENFQLVLVENGSRDNSSAEMQRLKAGEVGKWFRVEKVEVNCGYGFGLWSGLKTTSAPIVAWSHADQQCDPADAMKAYLQIANSKTTKALVKGERYGRNWKDRIVSRVFEFCALVILGLRVREMNAQPKVFSRELLSLMKDPPKSFAFDLYALYIAQKNNFAISTIPVLFPPRAHGVSNWASSFLGRYKTILGMIKYMWQLSTTEGRV